MAQNTITMTKRFHKRMATLLCLLLILMGIFFACKKTEPQEIKKNNPKPVDRFFDIPEMTDSTVIAVAATVKRQSEERHLVDKLIDRAGYPVWDKARVSIKDNPNEKQVFIPFVQDAKKQTRAILIARIKNTDTSFSLLYNTNAGYFPFRNTKPGTWNAKDIFHAFIAFDNAIFGHTKFTVKNGRYVDDTTGASHKIEIIKPEGLQSNSPGTEGNRSQNLYPVTTWVTFITCGLCAFKESTVNAVERCCNATYNTVPVTYWLNEETDEVSYDLPPGYTEGPGGMICPGCSWEDTNPCDIEPPYTQFCDADWQPTLHIPAYNPFVYDDTMRISNGLETVFPCIASFIRDSLSNPNLLAQIAGADVFHDSVDIKLTFDTSTVYTSGTSPYTAVTTYAGLHPAFVNDQGITVFSATIKLNPWHLRNATREFNISNILHEIMHAAFTLRWGQYLDWLDHHDTQYDSNFIKAKFPMYWYGIQNQAVELSSLQDHEIMATDYVGQFSYIMRQFYNPNASTATRDTVIKALAYHGLLETTVWKDLPRLGIDTCKYKNMQVSAEKASLNQAATGCGGSTVYRYAQDLKLRAHCQ
jgi:hypothetical protein